MTENSYKGIESFKFTLKDNIDGQIVKRIREIVSQSYSSIRSNYGDENPVLEECGNHAYITYIQFKNKFCILFDVF